MFNPKKLLAAILLCLLSTPSYAAATLQTNEIEQLTGLKGSSSPVRFSSSAACAKAPPMKMHSVNIRVDSLGIVIIV